VAVLGAGLTNLILLVSIAFVPQFGRIARAQTLAIRNSLYFEAEQVRGPNLARSAAACAAQYHRPIFVWRA
jgi:ABC-type dipeptide/oligopeptide/nickel transport system permease subunit